MGRTARAEATGTAFTFVSPEEENDLRGIERAIGRRLPRVTVPDFDYQARAAAKLEVPLAERIAAIRARKADERARVTREGRAPHGGRGQPLERAASRRRRRPPRIRQPAPEPSERNPLGRPSTALPIAVLNSNC